jgi:hypothetical protein
VAVGLPQARTASARTRGAKSVALNNRAGVKFLDLGYGYPVTGNRAAAISVLKGCRISTGKEKHYWTPDAG